MSNPSRGRYPPARQHLAVNSRLSAESRTLFDLIDARRALLEDHFALLSGKHSSYFLRFSQLGRDANAARTIAKLLAQLAPTTIDETKTILAAESAAYLLGRALSKHTGRPMAVARIDERRNPTKALRSGEVEGQQVIVVTDVVTSGGSLSALLDLVEQERATPACVLAFATLDPRSFARFLNQRGVPGEYVVSALWEPVEVTRCAQCKAGESIMPALELN